MVRVNRVVVALAAAVALSLPTLAYAQRGGHGGGHTGGGRAPSSVGQARPAGAPTAVPSAARNGSGQPIIGTAGQRKPGTGPGSFVTPFFFPGGLGFGYGLAFNPFFGSAAFGFGYGYDPFFYDPLYPFGYGYSGLGYPGLGYGYPWGYGGLGYGYPGAADPYAYDDQYRRGTPPSAASHETGAIRLKVSPETAQVYIDGTLAGTASDFDGLVGHHLVLDVGSHQLELRADGHETFHDTIVVEANKTLTERASLKKTK